MLIPVRRWLRPRVPAALFLVLVACVALSAQDRGAATTDAGEEAAPGDSLAQAASDTSTAEGEAKRDQEGTASEFSVLRAYICRGIDQSEPTEAGKSFIPDEGMLHLWCFSEIGGPARQDTIMHVWYWGEKEMARVALEVKGPRWRTWSTKRILDEWSGEWHVDIADSEGDVLSRLDFSIEQPR